MDGFMKYLDVILQVLLYIWNLLVYGWEIRGKFFFWDYHGISFSCDVVDGNFIWVL